MNYLNYMSPAEKALGAVSASNVVAPFVLFWAMGFLARADVLEDLLTTVPWPLWAIIGGLYVAASVLGYRAISAGKKRERQASRKKVRAAAGRAASGTLLSTCRGCGAVKPAGRSACLECGETPTSLKLNGGVRRSRSESDWDDVDDSDDSGGFFALIFGDGDGDGDCGGDGGD